MKKIRSSESCQDEIDVKLAKLRKATIAVEKLLFGELANLSCRAAIEPDWSSVKLPLLRLTAVYGVHCEELARILTCRSKILPAPKLKDEAVGWLFSKGPPNVIQGPAGYMAIQSANESRDLDFFKELGETIKGWHERKSPIVHGDLNELRFTLLTWWQPSGDWPGLAYCKLAARCDFLTILEKHQVLSFPFVKKTTPKNLDVIRKRLGLDPARSPFISHITDLGSSVRFS